MFHKISFSSIAVVAIGLLTAASGMVNRAQAASFGINFGAGIGRGNGGWGPYFLDPSHGTSAWGYAGHASAFGVPAANWYEPGSVANTDQLPGAPSSVPFQAPGMGSNHVDIRYDSFKGWTGQPGYPYPAFGFANANQYETVDLDMDGQPDLQANGWYVAGPLKPENGQPQSGEHAVLSGFVFATAENEYLGIENPWPAQDIVIKISGMSSIATSYSVRLFASAQNGNPYNLVNGVHAFTPATVSDNASNSETVSFTLMPDHPNYWSLAQSFEVDNDPDTHNPYVSVAGQGATTVTFTGDMLEIRLSGANEYYNDNGDFTRTTLAGVIIDYTPTAQPPHPGDFNGDGKVDGADFVIWQTNFPKDSGGTLATGDANGDGKVDGADFVIWQTNFPYPSGGASPVPEPGAMLLGAVASLGLVGMRKKFAGQQR